MEEDDDVMFCVAMIEDEDVVVLVVVVADEVGRLSLLFGW